MPSSARPCGQPLQARRLACCTPEDAGCFWKFTDSTGTRAVHKQMLELLPSVQSWAEEAGRVAFFQCTYAHLRGLNSLSGLARNLFGGHFLVKLADVAHGQFHFPCPIGAPACCRGTVRAFSEALPSSSCGNRRGAGQLHTRALRRN